jgi:putative DNA primase/helicase
VTEAATIYRRADPAALRANVPKELKAKRAWLLWKQGPAPEAGKKRRKVPCYASGVNRRGELDSPEDRAQLVTFDEAMAAYLKNDQWVGLGLALGRDFDLSGIDLDDCVLDGALANKAQKIIDAAGGYTEISPSGKGVKIFGSGDIGTQGNDKSGLELYSGGRFFTVTGAKVTGERPADLTAAAAMARELYRKPKPATKTRDDTPSGQLLAKVGRALRVEKKTPEEVHALFDTTDPHALSRELMEKNGACRAVQRCIEKVLRDSPQEMAYAVIECFADIEEKPLEWLTRGGVDVPLGKLTAICGDPGVSKSTVMLDLAAAITAGARPPWNNALRGDVLIMSAEDDAADTIKPRLRIAGADLARVHILTAVRDRAQDGRPRERGFNLAEDAALLDNALSQRPGVRLAVIDPVSAYMGKTDSHKNAEVRGVLDPVAKVAAARRTAIAAVAHMNKGDTKNVIYRVMGSLAFIGAPRAAFLVTRDPDNPERRLILSLKQNLTKELPGGFAYRLLDVDDVPKILWEAERVVDVTAQEALADGGRKNERDEEVEQWLKDELAAGAQPAHQMWEQAEAHKFSKNRIKAAKSALHIRSDQRKQEDGRQWWWWSLPGKAEAAPRHQQPPDDL